MNGRILFLLVFSLFATSSFVYAQEPNDTTKTERELKDGTEYIGYILSDDGREILLDTKELGKIYIPKSEIHSIVNLSEHDFTKSGKYDPTGVFTTRYYFTNNALPIAKRDNYAMVHLYGPELHFAAGKGFSAGIMTTWGASPFIGVVKQSIKTKNEKVNFSLGTMIGSSGYLNTFRGYGAMHWGTFTYGTPKNNLSISAGYLYVQPGFKNQNIFKLPDGIYNDTLFYSEGNVYDQKASKMFKTPMFSLAGIAKVGSKASFIFDSMFSISMHEYKNEELFSEDSNGNGYIDYNEYFRKITTAKELTTMFFLMPGMRFQKSDRRAFQVALAGCVYIRKSQTTAFPVPMCSWFFKI